MDSFTYAKATLLTVLAHPDDETFGTGGTLAFYAQCGVSIHLICATRGEVGDVPVGMMVGYESVGDLRESELRCAAEQLGLAGVHFLGYRDSGMPGSPDNQHPLALIGQPQEEVAARVTTYIRKLKPQVVITFDPIGGYHHPDHIAIHKATVLAFKYAADPRYHDPEDLPAFQPDRLYFQTMPKRMVKAAVRLMRLTGKDPHKSGRNQDIDLVAIASEEFPIHAEIDYRPVISKRDAAAACHASQGGKEMTHGIQKMLENIFRTKEQYMQAYPQPTSTHRINDLFAGIPNL